MWNFARKSNSEVEHSDFYYITFNNSTIILRHKYKDCIEHDLADKIYIYTIKIIDQNKAKALLCESYEFNDKNKYVKCDIASSGMLDLEVLVETIIVVARGIDDVDAINLKRSMALH